MSAPSTSSSASKTFFDRFFDMDAKEHQQAYLDRRWKVSVSYLERCLGPVTKEKQRKLWVYLIGMQHSLIRDIQRTVKWVEEHAEQMSPKELGLCQVVGTLASTQLLVMEHYPTVEEVCKQAEAKQNYVVLGSMRSNFLLPAYTVVKTEQARIKAQQALSPKEELSEEAIEYRKGAGGMYGCFAHVKRVTVDGRNAALKTTFRSQRGTATVYLPYETQLLRRVDGHRNIIRYLGEGWITPKGEILPKYSVALKEGGKDLDAWLRKEKDSFFFRRWEFASMISLAIQAAAAVERCHSRGVVHGDISLANFLMGNKRGTLKLIDFGLSWDENLPLQLKCLRHTTLKQNHFAPPELLSGGEVTPATDIYRLGICLYVMSSGHFLAETRDDLSSRSQGLYDAIFKSERPPIEDCHPLMRPILEGCLHKDPSKRPVARLLMVQLYEVALALDSEKWLERPPKMQESPWEKIP